MKKRLHFLLPICLLLFGIIMMTNGVFADEQKPLQKIQGPSSLDVKVGLPITLSYKASGRIVYKVSNSNIIKIENGKLIGLKVGSAKLYVAALSSGKYRYTRIYIPVNVTRQSQNISVGKIPTLYPNKRVALNVQSGSSRTY